MNLGAMEGPRAEIAIGRNLTLTEQLESKKKNLEEHLDEVNKALAGLKKNPELEGLLNLISRVRY